MRTAEGHVKRKYTRRSKAAIPDGVIAHAIAEKTQEPIKGKRGQTDFARMVEPYKKDTIVRAFVGLRKKLFSQGSSVDQITNMLRKRCEELSVKGNVIH